MIFGRFFQEMWFSLKGKSVFSIDPDQTWRIIAKTSPKLPPYLLMPYYRAIISSSSGEACSTLKRPLLHSNNSLLLPTSFEVRTWAVIVPPRSEGGGFPFGSAHNSACSPPGALGAALLWHIAVKSMAPEKSLESPLAGLVYLRSASGLDRNPENSYTQPAPRAQEWSLRRCDLICC